MVNICFYISEYLNEHIRIKEEGGREHIFQVRNRCTSYFLPKTCYVMYKTFVYDSVRTDIFIFLLIYVNISTICDVFMIL